jgi:type IV pilus assembly protein PilQ
VDFNALSAVNETTTTGTGLNQALTGSIMESGKAGAINDRGFVAGRAGGGGLNIGVVKNNVGVFVQALEGITDTVVLANPKVLALNKQKGEVIVGRKDGYMTSTTTESSTVQTVEFLETGTRLVFRPFIGDDGYIRMEIHPEDSSGGLAGEANLPFKITTEVTSNVMVKDGNTIVIGGLFREDSNTSRGQVPFLGNLPLAGALFRKQSDHTLREEVIILLTPHIVKDDAAYSSLSEEALKEAETLRVGVRHDALGTRAAGRVEL